MDSQEFSLRTKMFALRVIRLCEALPRGGTVRVLSRQLLRAGTSVGANYRAAARARSPAEFIAKLGIVEEECDECIYWMELLVESGLAEAHQFEKLTDEASQILAMVIASIKTARARQQATIRNPQSAVRN